VEDQLASLESVSDPGARVVRLAALDAVASLVELYGAGLNRILGIVARASDPAVAAALNAEFARDEVVSQLLLIHDLHPDPVGVRVQRALDEVHESHRKKNGHVELVGMEFGEAKLRIVDAGQGCHSTGAELKRLAEEAILAAAPELARVDTIIATDAPPPTLIPLVHRHGGSASELVEAAE
jgi:Fe-S cluster biogenesis protein NfuA